MLKELTGSFEKTVPHKAFLGFDGFIDEVVHVVKTRRGPDDYTRMDTLAEYGAFIAAGSGLSSNVEIMTIRKKIGGNGPIMACALKRMGCGIVYVGSIGVDARDAVFGELTEGATAIGVAEPGRTDAMEFMDGKLIRSKLDSLNQVCWENVLERVSAQELAELCGECDLLGFANWSLLANMTGIYRGFLEEVLPKIRNIEGKKMFFDLADPEKRPANDIKEVLGLIRKYTMAGCDTVLGLNKKEGCEIAELYGMDIPDYNGQELQPLATFLKEHLHVCTLVIHPADRACCIGKNGYAEEKGPYCERPALTTGAGDNFNAGFIFGYMNGLSENECLLLGNAASGYYVRNAGSASREELRSFLEAWEEGSLV